MLQSAGEMFARLSANIDRVFKPRRFPSRVMTSTGSCDDEI